MNDNATPIVNMNQEQPCLNFCVQQLSTRSDETSLKITEFPTKYFNDT